MSRRYFLVRSAPTSWDQEGRLGGTASLPLAPDAVASTRSLAREPISLGGEPLAALYWGPERSVQESAEVLRIATGVPGTARPRLRELDLGFLGGLLASDVAHRFGRRWRAFLARSRAVVSPKGESVEEASDRLASEVARLSRRHPEGVLALVLAPLAWAVLLSVLEARSLDRVWALSRSEEGMRLVAVP